MWKQLTQRARKTIFTAQEEAERLGYNHVEPEHLLLALIRDEGCVAARIIECLGHDLGSVRAILMRKLTRGSEGLEDLQLSPLAKQVIDYAFAEGKQMQEDWVGTEHLLMGLSQASGSAAAKLLTDLGVNTPSIRRHLTGMRTGMLPFELEGQGVVSPMAV